MTPADLLTWLLALACVPVMGWALEGRWVAAAVLGAVLIALVLWVGSAVRQRKRLRKQEADEHFRRLLERDDARSTRKDGDGR